MTLLYSPGRLLWRMPGPFFLANLLGPSYRLRCTLIHHISDESSPFTDGLGVTVTQRQFEDHIRFIVRHYTPISLEMLLAARRGEPLPRRPILITFDDAYASVADRAATVCAKFKVPATFFVNAGFLDNNDLALDNLLCYLANRLGFERFRETVVRVIDGGTRVPESLAEVFADILPMLSLDRRVHLHDRLSEYLGRPRTEIAKDSVLYLSSEQLRALIDGGFEIANHTYSHVHCRILAGSDFEGEIVRNQTTLQRITGRRVRAFSVPYGSSADVTAGLVDALRRTGHEALFLVESGLNTPATDPFRQCRVSIHASTDADTFGEIEVLPRMRAIRDRFSSRRRRERQRVARAVAERNS